MSPILVRPVREQLEHDRVIRLLQARFRRRFDVGINPGAEQNTGVNTAGSAVYPDVVLVSQDRGRKVMAVIEVETVESVNNLEALAEWVPFGRLKSAFHLYVPAQMIEVAKRLCTDSHIPVAEIHSYHWIGDEMRFVPVYKAPTDGRSNTATLTVKAEVRPPTSAKASTKSVPAKPATKPAPPKASARPASAKASARQAGGQKTPRRAAAKKTAAKPRKKIGRSAKRK